MNDNDISTVKDRLWHNLEKFRNEAEALGKHFFSIAETGFNEERTEKEICACLETWGLSHQKHLARHGVHCVLSSGNPGYHAAVIADIDALLVQQGRESIPFHSCGHSIQTTILLNLIRAFQESRIIEFLPGKVSFIFCPAEEFIEIEERRKLKAQGIIRAFSGKQQLIADSFFDDIDAVLSCHVMNPDPNRPDLRFDTGSSLAGFLHKRIEFSGRNAHAGAAPHLGRNAFHAASLSLTAIQMLKDTFPPEAHIKLYPIISDGGGESVNTICAWAVMETYLRAQDEDSLRENSQRLDRLFQSCAQALEVECRIITSPGYLPFRQNPGLNAVISKNIEEQCNETQIARNIVSGASGDIGDLSAIIPTVQFGFSGIAGRVHSTDFRIIDSVHVYENTAKVLAGAIVDLLGKEELQVRYEDKEERKKRYLSTWLGETP